MRYLLGICVLLIGACAAAEDPGPIELTTTQPVGGFRATPLPPFLGADGNRVASTSGAFDVEPVAVITQRAAAVVRVDLPFENTLAITYGNGESRIIEEGSTEMKVRSVPSATSIVYGSGPNGVDIVSPLPDQVTHSRPGVLPAGQLAYVATNGDVVVWNDTELARASVDALPDGDVLVDEQGRILVLTGPTERYAHGVMGDAVEASGFIILAPPDLAVVGRGTVGAPAVIEGRRAIWTDLHDDGSREVQLTVSAPDTGARLIVMAEDGTVLNEGEPVGQSNRWRHQIAFGRFTATAGSVEVITPHIGGIVSFVEFGRQLRTVATAQPFTSHQIGSRELDMAVAVDIDDDGFLELLVPTQDRMSLVAVGIVDGSATVKWEAQLPAAITSNVAIGSRNGGSAIAVGTEDGSVLIWQSGS
ncbi:MAG: hypothetical protein GY720_21350 [bacterium]|nr:hypothetical protein [bacterium]